LIQHLYIRVKVDLERRKQSLRELSAHHPCAAHAAGPVVIEM